MAALRAATIATTIQPTCDGGHRAETGGDGRRSQRERQSEHRMREADHPPIGEDRLERARPHAATVLSARLPREQVLVGVVRHALRGREGERGALARRQRAEVLEAERGRATRGRHAHDGSRIERGEEPMQQHGVVEHVERVHARQAVRPQRETDARGQQGRHVRDSHAQVPVAAGTEHHVDPAPRQQLAVRGVHLDAVGRHQPRVQRSLLLEVTHRAHPWRLEGDLTEPAAGEKRGPGTAAFEEERALIGRLREVNGRRPAALREQPQQLGRDRVRRVRCKANVEPRPQQRSQSPSALLRPLEAGGGLRRVPGQELHEDHRVQPRARQQAQMGEPVRDVADGRGPALLEERDRRRGRRPHLFLRELPAGGDERLDPAHEAVPEGNPAGQVRQLEVTVGVDEPRQQHAGSELASFAGGLPQGARPANPANAPALDGNGAAGNRRARDRQHPARSEGDHATLVVASAPGSSGVSFDQQ